MPAGPVAHLTGRRESSFPVADPVVQLADLGNVAPVRQRRVCSSATRLRPALRRLIFDGLHALHLPGRCDRGCAAYLLATFPMFAAINLTRRLRHDDGPRALGELSPLVDRQAHAMMEPS